MGSTKGDDVVKRLLCIGLILCCMIGVLSGCGSDVTEQTAEVQIEVPEGATTTEIATLLKENGIIKNEKKFIKESQKSGNDQKYKSGIAALHGGMELEEIMDVLVNQMQPSGVKVTVPEGYNLDEITKLLVEKELIDEAEWKQELREGAFDYWFLKDAELPKGTYRLEGFLFPDTYRVKEGASEHDILDMMLKRFETVYTQEYQDRAKELDLSDLEILTLASIIEKEASVDLDKISSVFHNRLKDPKYKYLESCATVIYVTGEKKDRLTLQDTKVKSPYNTYINPGLPPGPICSPGKAAIEAALYPAETDYLFFSANGDGTNSFSKTYDEHLSKQP